MKVLVADKFEQSGLDGLKGLGVEVLFEPDLKDEALGGRIKESEAEVLVVRSTKVTEPMMEGSNLKLVIRAGAGYNTIEVDAASAREILVANCPGKNAQAVAELVFGLMIGADRHIPDNVADLRAGKWNKKAYSQARGLYGRTLGLVGMGNISRQVLDRALAFGMKVLVISGWLSDAEAEAMGTREVRSLDELARESDFISVHESLRSETQGMIGEAFFSVLRPGTVFINTSRAEIVDQAAMMEAVAQGRIVAALDVFEGEPSGGEGAYDGPLSGARGVYCTHHIGASTDQAQEAVADEVVQIVAEFQRTGVPPNVVNAK